MSKPLRRWVGVATILVIGVLLVWLSWHMRIGIVTSDSMMNTLRRGDWYIIRIDAYRKSSPQRGDIVVVRRPQNGEHLVKRVIGLPGDIVGVWRGHPWVNGQWLEEPYIDHNPGVIEPPTLTRVPRGQLFLMGDNRNFSEDSRDIGTLSIDDVIGRVSSVIYPWGRRKELERPSLRVPPAPRVRL